MSDGPEGWLQHTFIWFGLSVCLVLEDTLESKAQLALTSGLESVETHSSLHSTRSGAALRRPRHARSRRRPTALSLRSIPPFSLFLAQHEYGRYDQRAGRHLHRPPRAEEQQGKSRPGSPLATSCRPGANSLAPDVRRLPRQEPDLGVCHLWRLHLPRLL